MSKPKKLTKKEKKHRRMKVEQLLGARPFNYLGPLPRPLCRCNGAGCWGCMDEFVPNTRARWLSIDWRIDPCSKITLPTYTPMAALKYMLNGTAGGIDAFRIFKSK